MAFFTAFSLALRLILAMPQAPPISAKGMRTIVALATAMPPYRPALVAAAAPAAMVAPPAATPAAPEARRPSESSLPSTSSWRHSATALSIRAGSPAGAEADADAEAMVGLKLRGFDEQPLTIRAGTSSQPMDF